MNQVQQPMLVDATSILLTCLSYENGSVTKERLARVLADEYHQVVALAQSHNLVALLNYRLQQLNVTLPDDLTQELMREQRKNTLQIMSLYLELNNLLGLFQDKDIAVIVLKGAYLAQAVYDQIGLRTMRDIDLLVAKKDLLSVEQVLLACGYMSDDTNRVVIPDIHHFSYKRPGSRFRVEIHWTIFDESLPLRIDVDGLWSRAQHISLAQASAFALSPEDLLLHLCLHVVLHAYDLHDDYEMRLRMLCDVGEVLRRFGANLDWQVVGERARQWGAVRALYVVLQLAHDLLCAGVPLDWLQSLQPENFNENYLALARQQILAERGSTPIAMHESSHLARLSGSMDLGSKLALIRERLLPAREIMALKYPVSATAWRIYFYYPVRWTELIVHYGVSLWHLGRGDPQTRSIAQNVNQIIELRDWLMSS